MTPERSFKDLSKSLYGKVVTMDVCSIKLHVVINKKGYGCLGGKSIFLNISNERWLVFFLFLKNTLVRFFNASSLSSKS